MIRNANTGLSSCRMELFEYNYYEWSYRLLSVIYDAYM